MRTLRTRLLVGLALGITLFLAATGAAVDVVVDRHFRSELDRSLAMLLESTVADVLRESGRQAMLSKVSSMAVRAGHDRPGGPRPSSSFFSHHADILLQAWDAEGETVVRSVGLGEADLPTLAAELEPVSVMSIADTELTFADIELPLTGGAGRAVAVRISPVSEGRHARFIIGASRLGTWNSRPGFPILSGEIIAEIDSAIEEYPQLGPLQIVIAQGTSAMTATLTNLRWLLALGWLISSLGCAGIASWIIHRGLRPLEGLRRQMGTVQSADLAQEFSLPDAPGELQPVVTQLNELMARIRASFVREQAFTADAAHELRTPLAGLRSTLEVSLRRTREEPEYRKALETSLAITLEMQSLVEVLLEMARTSRTDDAVEFASTSVQDLLDASWRPFVTTAERRNLALTQDVIAGTAVRTDLPLFRRVLQNLFENAVSYAQEGTPIEVNARETGEGSLTLSVGNRVGEVPEDLAERAFDAFWRADTARSSTGRHAGLGLALCRRIVDTLGGTIDATCREGRFTVTLSLPQA